MAILTRYIGGQTLAALALILVSLTAVVWIAVALKQLRIVTSSAADTWAFLLITTLTVPNLLSFVAPVALLIAALHVLNRLNGDSELIILTASGGTTWWIIRPFVMIAVVVSAAVLFVNLYAMPYSLRMARDMLLEKRSDLIGQLLQEGKFSTPVRGVTVHVRERSVSGQLRGLLVHDQRNPKELLSVTAETGQIVKADGAPFLLMSNGHIIRQEGLRAPSQIIRFEQYPIELTDFSRKPDGNYSYKPKERFIGELLAPDPNDIRVRRQPGKLRAELHERFSSPLYPLAFVLIAIASIGQAQSTRSNRTKALVAGFIAATVLRLIGMSVNKMVTSDAAMVPLLYAVPIIGAALAMVIIWRNAIPQRGPSLTDRLRRSTGARGAALRKRLPAWAGGDRGRGLPVPGE
ncbi:MAG: LPS export ABC transporter permease LptF [Pseudomonadota bacterium]